MKTTLMKQTALVLTTMGLMVGNLSALHAAELTDKMQGIVPIAAFTAQGDTKNLRTALIDGMEKEGLTVNEIKDVIVQMYAYTGFPRSLTGLNTFLSLLNERKDAGIKDNWGRKATPVPAGTNIRELGTKTQTRIVGRPVSAPVYDFSPEIDTYLKEHLFGDIFSSDLLTLQEREVATIAALAALPAPTQLRSHFNGGLNAGLSPAALKELTQILNDKVGSEEGKLATQTLEGLLKARQQN